ncbi:MAG: hypothetical protein M1493_12180 [Firmicutes bacterium]|nr:hypothetical protein [Bacillota bacterium]
MPTRPKAKREAQGRFLPNHAAAKAGPFVIPLGFGYSRILLVSRDLSTGWIHGPIPSS